MAMESMSMTFSQSHSRSRMSSFSSQNGGLTASSSVGVKIGGLWKRSQGLSRFTKANYKHRVFILTDHSLSYYAGTVDRVGQMKGRIDLTSIRAVEFVDINAFNLAHTIQIVHYSKKSGFVKLYVTATDKSEAADWVSALRQVCYFNKDMLMHYHPGAFLRNKWTCCQQRGRVMLGCQPTYHLLTRSSSRYAQMRRKDTLTNKQHRPRHGSGASAYSTVDRLSNTTSDSTNLADVNGHAHSKPGQGLSNSCVDLTIYPPHRIESFIQQQSPALNRVSFASSSGPPSGTELEMSGGGGLSRGSSQSLKRRSRSQVAPESSPAPPISNFPVDGPSLTAFTDSPLVTNTSRSLDTNSLQRSGTPSDHSHESDHESSPPPIPPPRQKRGVSSLTQSHSIHFVPRVTPISETNSPPSSFETTTTTPRQKSNLKHSNTFVVQRSAINSEVKYGRKIDRGLSHSMSALSKPLIEPKVSATNPNVIHV